jgi:hypothetical protein
MPNSSKCSPPTCFPTKYLYAHLLRPFHQYLFTQLYNTRSTVQNMKFPLSSLLQSNVTSPLLRSPLNTLLSKTVNMIHQTSNCVKNKNIYISVFINLLILMDSILKAKLKAETKMKYRVTILVVLECSNRDKVTEVCDVFL